MSLQAVAFNSVKVIIGIFLLSVTTPGAFAQGNARGQAAPVTLRVLAEVTPSNISTVYFQSPDESFKGDPFKLTTLNLSPPQEVKSRVLQVKPEGGEGTLCNFTLPGNGKSFIVILIPAQEAGYQAEIVAADAPNFKPGSVFFFNRTKYPIRGRLGANTIRIEPRKSVIAKPTGSLKKGYYDIGFALEEGKKLRVFSTTRWPINDPVRSYIFFISTEDGRIKYRAVDEFIPVSAKKS